MTQFQILTDSRTTKVEITIFHTDIITAIRIILNGEWRCQTLAEDIQFFHQNLDITCRHLRVLALTLTHLTFDLNTELTAQFVGAFTELCIVSLIENELRQSITIAKVDEGHSTHLTTTLYPSGKCHYCAGI